MGLFNNSSKDKRKDSTRRLQEERDRLLENEYWYEDNK